MKARHEVLIVPYRSGKSWTLLQKAIDHCQQRTSGENGQQPDLKSETIIIVPSQRYRALTEKRLKLLLKKENNQSPGHGLWGLKILTFQQFCQMSLLKSGTFLKILPQSARAALIVNISNQLLKAGKIKKLAPLLGSVGTQGAILEIIDEWQRAGYRAEQIIKQVQQKNNGHPFELAQIYLQYENTLRSSKYIDKHGVMFKLIDLLKVSNKADWLNDFIIVDGFDRWHKLQLQLLKVLARHVPQLYISFDYQKSGNDLFEEYSWKETSYEQINNLLKDAFTFSEITVESKEQPEKITEVFAASDRIAEMSMIAAAVKAALVLDKVNADQIVVTARNLKAYRAAIEATFQDAGLDYYIDEPIAMLSLPLIRFLLSLLSLSDNDFPRRQLIDCLRSPYFHLSNFGLNPEDIEYLNELSLDLKVVGGQDQWHVVTRDNLKLDRAIKKVFVALTPGDHLNSAVQYATWVEDLLASVLDLSLIDDHQDPIFAWKQKEALNKFRQILAALIEEETIVDEIVGAEEAGKDRRGGLHPPVNNTGAHAAPLQITDNAPQTRRGGRKSARWIGGPRLARWTCGACSARSFYARLFQLIEKSNFPGLPPGAGKVLITGAEMVPNQQYKQIYIAGMLEGEFPAIKSRKGFLTNEALGEWRRLGMPVYDPRLEPGFEYALFASLVNRAQQKLVLSYPAADISSSKDEFVPSFFLTGTGFISEEKRLQPLSFADFKTAANSPCNTLAYTLWHWQTHQLPIFKTNHLLDTFTSPLAEKFAFAANRANQIGYSSLNGYLTDHVAASTVKISMPDYWSASHLNNYGKCPFYYWLKRMIKVEPHEEPQAGLSIMDRGTFYHRALELFYKELIEKKLSPLGEQRATDGIVGADCIRPLLSTGAHAAALQEIFDRSILQAIDWLERQPWFRPTEFWTQEKAELSFRLKNFFVSEIERFNSENAQFVPYMVEAEFGPDKTFPPLSLEESGKSLKFTGKIDRIDIERSGSSISESRGPLCGRTCARPYNFNEHCRSFGTAARACSPAAN